ncbi:MAG: hypothetical protein NTY80_01590 [candidate division SR1 bacterium]|nr:hypothetical protein [candidate division SR1 bacterium]
MTYQEDLEKNELSIRDDLENSKNGEITISDMFSHVETTRKKLLNAIINMSDSADFIAMLNKEQLNKKQEEYELLKPAGFEHAPKSAKKMREELKDDNDIKELKWLQDNISRNVNHTMNIIQLKKIFCRDISGENKRFTLAQAQELEKTNVGGYRLMTDYNDSDSEEKEKQNDWYQVINVFSNGDGDTYEGISMFRDMSGCIGRYWTATKYKNGKGEENPGIVMGRILDSNSCHRHCLNIEENYRVCGLKDSA